MDLSRLQPFFSGCPSQETDRVPLGEILIDYSIQSKFLTGRVSGRRPGQPVEFWAKAPMTISITVSMMSPEGHGGVQITKWLKEMCCGRNPAPPTPRPGLSSPASSTNSRTWTSSLGRPRPTSISANCTPPRSCFGGHEGDRHFREDLHPGPGMLMGFNNFA